MIQKGNVLVILLALVAIIGVSAAGFFYLQTQQLQQAVSSQEPVTSKSIPSVTPTPAPTTADETANWKTYTNTKYGYSIKYPEVWVLVKMSEIGQGGVDQLYSYQPPEIQVKDPNFGKNKAKIEIGKMIQSKNPGQTLEDWLTSYDKSSSALMSTQISQKTLTLAGVKAIERISKSNINDYERTNFYFLEKGSEIYFISVFGDLAKLQPIIDQIIFTFRFD